MRVVHCPYCLNRATLEDHPHGGKEGKVWMCAPCDAWTGTHKNSSTFAPLGRLASADLRRMRHLAHRAFDPIWENRYMSRAAAYRWLARRFKNHIRIHIGFLNAEECQRVIDLAHELRRTLKQETQV